jgi:hypothetical protein
VSEEIVHAESSPNINVEAIVEQDDRVAYFYLRGDPQIEFGLRTCWVRNVRPAPKDLDVKGMRRGTPPMLPAAQCKHPQGAPPLRAEDLEIVWFEEGDAAALVENGEVLAVVPCWSGQNGFDGYARDCIGQSPLAWELEPDNVLLARIGRAADYWRSWDDDENNPWTEVQDSQIEAYSQQLGNYDKYYAIDGGEWPPKALVRIPLPSAIALVTVGVCLRPQPTVEMYADNPEELSRIELGMALDPSLPAESLNACGSYISAQSRLPWTHCTWLGEGHTIPFDALPGGPYSAVLLQRSPQGAAAAQLPSFRGDPVNLLWMTPITAAERKFAEEHGSRSLAGRLAAAGQGWIAPMQRRSVV